MILLFKGECLHLILCIVGVSFLRHDNAVHRRMFISIIILLGFFLYILYKKVENLFWLRATHCIIEDMV